MSAAEQLWGRVCTAHLPGLIECLMVENDDADDYVTMRFKRVTTTRPGRCDLSGTKPPHSGPTWKVWTKQRKRR